MGGFIPLFVISASRSPPPLPHFPTLVSCILRCNFLKWKFPTKYVFTWISYYHCTPISFSNWIILMRGVWKAPPNNIAVSQSSFVGNVHCKVPIIYSKYFKHFWHHFIRIFFKLRLLIDHNLSGWSKSWLVGRWVVYIFKKYKHI